MAPMSARCSAVLIGLGAAVGAFPSSLPIDQASFDALIAGQDVCGDANHRDSCLRVADCAEVDPVVGCTAAEPVWLPDPTRGGVRDEMLFRHVLPLPAGPHPNSGSLGTSKLLLVGSLTYQLLPSAVALYGKSAVSKTHSEHCSTRYCVIPAAIYTVVSAAVSYPSSKIRCSEVLSECVSEQQFASVLGCMGFSVSTK